MFNCSVILPIRWWQEQPLTAKQICMCCCSANTFRYDSKCFVCICNYDPFLVFCCRVYFTLSCQRSSFTDHCWWSFPICAVSIGTFCSTEGSFHLLFSYPYTGKWACFSHTSSSSHCTKVKPSKRTNLHHGKIKLHNLCQKQPEKKGRIYKC